MSIDIYLFIKSKANNGVLAISTKEIAKGTGLSIKKVKSTIEKLKDDGFLLVEEQFDPETGAAMSNKYTVVDNPKIDRFASADLSNKIRLCYINHVSFRTGRPLDKYGFVGYNNVWKRISKICQDSNINPYIYIASGFFTFRKEWCTKTFNMSYPPPAILATKGKGIERYFSFMRYMSQHTPQIVDYKNIIEVMKDNLYIWRSTGEVTDEDFLSMLIENETLSPIFVVSFLSTSLTQEFKNKLINEHKITNEQLSIANNCLKGETL